MSLENILNFKIKIGNVRQAISTHIPVCEPMMMTGSPVEAKWKIQEEGQKAS